jgi:hypothetical protein
MFTAERRNKMSRLRLARFVSLVIALTALLIPAITAQQPDATAQQAKQEKVAALKQSLAANQAALKTSNHQELRKARETLALGFDPAAKKLRSYNVDSYVKDPKDDAVKLAVTFASLPDGTNYNEESVLEASGKKIQVKVTNTGYKRSDSDHSGYRLATIEDRMCCQPIPSMRG